MAHEPVKINRPAAVIPHSTVTSAAGAASTIALTPGAGEAIHVGSIAWSYDTTPTGGALTITDGVTPVSLHAPAAGPGFGVFDPALRFATGTAVTVTLAAGGGAVVGKITQVSAWKANNS